MNYSGQINNFITEFQRETNVISLHMKSCESFLASCERAEVDKNKMPMILAVTFRRK